MAAKKENVGGAELFNNPIASDLIIYFKNYNSCLIVLKEVRQAVEKASRRFDSAADFSCLAVICKKSEETERMMHSFTDLRECYVKLANYRFQEGNWFSAKSRALSCT